jgi:hypothetical protein
VSFYSHHGDHGIGCTISAYGLRSGDFVAEIVRIRGSRFWRFRVRLIHWGVTFHWRGTTAIIAYLPSGG